MMKSSPRSSDSKDRDDAKKAVLCPSSRCEEGAILLGVVGPDAQIGFLPDRMIVNREFVQIARQGRTPEKRFRFSSPCVKGACKQWTGTRCGVIDEVFGCVPSEHRIADLPDCSIRDQCRWFQQEGAEACAVCPLVITDLMVDDAP